jgi:rhomboid family GlyGly-CTERM serine protease
MDHRRISRYLAWSLPGATVALAALLELTGDWGRELFRYDRAAIAAGELWRLISGHLVHLGWPHFALNSIGLILVSYLVAAAFSARRWLLIAVTVIAGIDLGFWYLQPQLTWYVGLSGLLHGLLAAGVISGIRNRHVDSWVIAGFLLIKLAYEQLIGPLPGSEGTAGGEVVVVAHLYGAISGAVIGAWLCFRKAAHVPI